MGNVFESKEEFPSHTDLTVKTAQVLSEEPSNYASLPGLRNHPQLEVRNVIRPRKGHGY